MTNNNLSKRNLCIRVRKLTKASNVEVIDTGNDVFYKCNSINQTQLSEKQISNLYMAFLNLGHDIYFTNRKKLKKIRYCNYDLSCILEPLIKVTKENIPFIQERVLETLANLNKDNNIIFYNDNKYNSNKDYLFLKKEDIFNNCALQTFITNNYVPLIDEENNEDFSLPSKVYIDYEFLVKISIFIYLCVAAIDNSHSKYKYENKINFSDFIEVNDPSELSSKDYIVILEKIINMFESSYRSRFCGFNRLVYNEEYDTFDFVQEFNDVIGLMWYLFKLDISNILSFADKNGDFVHVSICGECGLPFLGNTIRCNNCDNTASKRVAKSMANKLANIEKIKKLAEKNSYSEEVKIEIDNIIKLTKTEQYHISKSIVDKLLAKLESLNNK